MTRMLIALLCSLCCVLFASAPSLADPHDVTFDKDGTAYIKCACILATSACVSSLGDAAAGSQRVTWTSVGHAAAGHTVDLSNYCWTKRNVSSEGGGLCCSIANDSTDVRFFWGDLDEVK